MAIVQEMNLNMIPDSIPVIIRVDQYDTGEGRLVAHLYEGPNAYTPAQGATAIIQGTKPDKKGFAYDATLNGSTVTADLTQQMSCVGGNTRCQFVVTEPTGRTGTFAFVLRVQDSALADDTDISETVLPVYIDAAQKAAEEAEEASKHYPYINETNYHWMVWDVEAEEWVDTGVPAIGTGLRPGTGIDITEDVISVDADTTPTSGSAKPVTSGGVYTALENKQNKLTAGANVQINNNTISATDTKYNNATQSTAGLMSASDKTKLDGIAAGAEVNVQANWTEADNTKDDYIKNKPTLAAVATSGSYNDLSNKPTLGTAAAKNSTNAVTSGSTALVESGAVRTAIDAAVSAVYKPSGDKTCAQLVSSLLEAANLGNVYNITDSGTTTSDFVEGAGTTIEAGDNVAIVDIGTGGSHNYKFDLLSGFVDLSGYQKKTTFNGDEFIISVDEQTGAEAVRIRTSDPNGNYWGLINADTAYKKMYSQNATAETTIDDADYFPYIDTSVGLNGVQRKTLWSNIKSVLKTYFDTLYGSLTDVATILGLIPSTATTSNKLSTAAEVANRVDWSSYAKTGVHQWFDFNKYEAVDSLVSGSTYDDFTISATGTWKGTVFDIDVVPNTDYKIRTDVVVTSGVGYINVSPYPSGAGFANSGNITSSKIVDFTFNSGENSKIKITCFCTTSTSETGNVEYKDFLLALAEDTNNDCTPYAKTNPQLTQDKVSYEFNARTGVHQLLDPQYFKPDTNAISESDVTKTDIGEVTFNGTSLNSSEARFYYLSTRSEESLKLIGGVRYKISIGTANENVSISLGYTGAGGAYTNLANVPFGASEYEFVCPAEADGKGWTIQLNCKANTVFNNYTVYPVLCFAEDSYTGKVPYAMTNQQITSRIKRTDFVANEDLNNYITDCVKTSQTSAISATLSHIPTELAERAFRLEVKSFNTQRVLQIAYPLNSTPSMFMRTNFGGTWGSWYKFTGTAV